MTALPARRLGFLLALLTTVVSATVQARMPNDLNLRGTLASRVIVMPKPNVHEHQDICTSCHPGMKANTPKPVQGAEEFLNDDYPENLCQNCHKEWEELHPHRTDLKKSRMKVSVPTNVLPLRYIAEGWYIVVCTTCHDVHFPHNGFKLLRGFSMNSKAQPSRFTDRIAFCESCHGDQMKYLTPHKVRNLQTGCTLCHVRKPSWGRPQPLRANVNTLCTYCHPVFPEPHYLHFNPFPDLQEKEIYESGVPLRDGAFTCITCHLPHGSAAAPSYLRKEYINLTRTSVRINPHETGLFCQNCHADPSLTRKSTVKSPSLVDNDVSALCSRCHKSGRFRTMHHYLGKMTERVKSHGNLPLSKKGEVTCITCHQPGCRPSPRDNPNFLRGNPASIRDLCKQCHDWTELATRNIHVEREQNQGCDLCHGDRIPAQDAQHRSADPEIDQNFVCIQCHEVVPHPASYRHTVKPAQAEYVRIDSRNMRLDLSQRVTCYTCHQICAKPAAGFWRGKAVLLNCSFCHPY